VNHSRWRPVRDRKSEPPEVVAEREQIRFAFRLGQLVYDRRTALGLSRSAPAERLGVTVDEVEAVELGGMLPLAADLLAGLEAALGLDLTAHPALRQQRPR
jgi:ribosome-binding protein aMBF1 (putative translation factor)